MSALVRSRNLSKLAEYGIRDDYLFDDARICFNWVRQYVETTGSFPSFLMVKESTGVGLLDEEEPVDYIADRVRQRALSNKLQKSLVGAAEYLEKREPDKALELIRKIGTDLDCTKTSLKIVSYREAGPRRFEEYRSVKYAGGFYGVQTPWASLNKFIQGWVDGTLNVITAKTGTGKSWLCCIIASYSLQLGKKILFVTMEMPINKISRRIDSIRYKIPFRDMRDTTIDDLSEEEWKRKLSEDVVGAGDILIVDKKSISYVSDVTSLVLNYKPEIVIIDGGYRFRGFGKSAWESTVSIVSELQLSAEITGKPWIVSTQQGDSSESSREKKSSHKMNGWGVRYGKEWLINPDVVIGFYQDDDLRYLQEAEFHLLKERDSAFDKPRFPIRIRWDMSAMDFSEVSESEIDSEIEV